jgi:hypothetical protein
VKRELNQLFDDLGRLNFGVNGLVHGIGLNLVKCDPGVNGGVGCVITH